jgi:DNA polymerase III sliding clamp (beta) subunit (PCNA family)
LNQILLAVADASPNPVLNSARIEVSVSEVKIIGLDGSQLAVRHLQHKTVSGAFEILLPKRSLHEIAHIGRSADVVRLGKARETNHCIFKAHDTTLWCLPYEGKYPQYGQLLAARPRCRINVNKRDLESAVTAADRLVGSVPHATLSASGEELRLRVGSNEVGEGSAVISCSTATSPAEATISARQLQNVLAVIPDSEVTLELGSKRDPIWIRARDLVFSLPAYVEPPAASIQ